MVSMHSDGDQAAQAFQLPLAASELPESAMTEIVSDVGMLHVLVRYRRGNTSGICADSGATRVSLAVDLRWACGLKVFLVKCICLPYGDFRLRYIPRARLSRHFSFALVISYLVISKSLFSLKIQVYLLSHLMCKISRYFTKYLASFLINADVT